MSYLQPLEFNECIIDSPVFREKLFHHEKEIDSSYKVFKDIYNSIKTIFKTLEDCSHAFQGLAENLNKYIHKEGEMFNNASHAETEDEKTIKLALSMYSDMISNIEMMRNEHILGATKALVFNDLQKLKDDCLSKSKQETKEFRKVTANYYSKLEKYVAIKSKVDGDFKNVDSEIMEDRRQYALRALDHVMNIQQTEEQKTCKLVHTLSLLIQMLNTYHHQAWDHFGDQKKKVDQINCALFRAEESYKTIAENSETLKQQKMSLPLEQIQPDSNNGIVRREGYLFVFTKKTVMSDIWTRNFCVYEKNTKKLILTPYNQTNQVCVSKLQSEEVILESCEQKKSGTFDRRFCFEIRVKARSTPIILQALSLEDRKQWMDIMGGKEPVYAQLNNLKIQEIETILNEKGLRFLSMCFSVIENRGIETQGIYRLSGRIGQCDKIMKKVAEDLKGNGNSDVISEKELETMEINIICSMVKSYIKYLRSPMATYELYEEFISAGKLQNYEDKFAAVDNIIKKLPKENSRLFSILFHHLKRISEFSEKNLMTAPNLGVCFSPTVFRPEQATASLTAIRESKFAGDVITILIEKCDDFFPTSDQIIRPMRLTASKSMYMSRNTSGDIFNSESHKSHLNVPHPNESMPSNGSNNISPKVTPKRFHAEHKTSDPTGILRSNTVKTPAIPPKPDIMKLSAVTGISPTTSPKLSCNPRLPRKLDLQKLQLFDGNNRQRSFKRAKTLYQYVAENEFQLSFDPNKIVDSVVDSEDPGWITGNIDGRIGLIPKSYVEMLPS